MKRILIALLFPLALYSQDNLKTQLFGEADQLMAQAKEKKAELYAPKSYAKALEYYREAEAAYRSDGRVEEIREKVKNAAAYFAKALDACKLAEVTFAATSGARTDANSAGAPKYSAELWTKAESQFNRAALWLEDGNLERARENGKEAETTYRTAELEAIKANYLGPARDLLKRAEDVDARDNAPKTLQRAKDLVAAVEVLLRGNRYDTDSARQLAQEAKYEAAHALHLHQSIEQAKRQAMTPEDAMLADEKEFQKVAGALGVNARFDNGYTNPVNECIAAIRDNDRKAAAESDKLAQAAELGRQKENEVDNLRQQIALMEKRLGTLTEAEKQLQDAGKELERKLAIQRQQEATIAEVATLFTDTEGKLLRDGNSIVIRLYGLTFPIGKSTIEPDYYPLLTKVQDAIKKFPNSSVTIEGHTDSQGSDEMNQTLSESRAKAVAEYLMANMRVTTPVNHQGYGESRPVASNDTPEGRAMNRRIDVLLTPEWAGK
jgi:outer membrane protein OmpA-like peptidoglycan-associated protein